MVLLALGWLMSTRLRRLGPTESLVPAVAFACAMVLLLYGGRFK